MSRIGNTPIKLPEGVKVAITGNKIKVTGKLGELEYEMQEGIAAKEEEGKIYFTRQDDSREQKSYHGLARALVNNMVTGVSEGFEKTLQVIGTGYTAERVGPWLRLALGYSHEIYMEVPENLDVTAQVIPRREQGKLGVQAVITVKGIYKEDVGKFAAEIRNCRPPENYKGKGVRYAGEWVMIKPGKSGTA